LVVVARQKLQDQILHFSLLVLLAAAKALVTPLAAMEDLGVVVGGLAMVGLAEVQATPVAILP
jgi:hypothetical protein